MCSLQTATYIYLCSYKNLERIVLWVTSWPYFYKHYIQKHMRYPYISISMYIYSITHRNMYTSKYAYMHISIYIYPHVYILMQKHIWCKKGVAK